MIRSFIVIVSASEGGGKEDSDTWFLVWSCYFTDQARLLGGVLVIFLMKYFNLLCRNVVLCVCVFFISFSYVQTKGKCPCLPYFIHGQ